MVEAAIQIKLLPTSILDIIKVFEHTGELSIGIQKQPYTLYWPMIDSDLIMMGYLVSENDVITSC